MLLRGVLLTGIAVSLLWEHGGQLFGARLTPALACFFALRDLCVLRWGDGLLPLVPHHSSDRRFLCPEDWKQLFAIAADPLIWEVHPARERYKEEYFRDYFREALESGGAVAAIDRKTRQIIGASRYFWYGPDQSELEIGWTFLSRAYWGGVYNGEMKRLMLDYAFQFVDCVIFLVGAANVRSQRAMLKIGGILTERRVQRSLHGETLEFVIYEIRKSDPTA
jgi:RimJ/RimL family protein N-acetyltransferase